MDRLSNHSSLDNAIATILNLAAVLVMGAVIIECCYHVRPYYHKMLKWIYIHLLCVIGRGTSAFVLWLVTNALLALSGIFRGIFSVAKLLVTAAGRAAIVRRNYGKLFLLLCATVLLTVTVLWSRSTNGGHSSSSDGMSKMQPTTLQSMSKMQPTTLQKTAVLPDPPVSISSRPTPHSRQYKESDSYRWHEERYYWMMLKWIVWMVMIVTLPLTLRFLVSAPALSWLVTNALLALNEAAVFPAWMMLRAIFVAVVDILEWMVDMTLQLTSSIFVGLQTMVVCAFSWLVSNALPTLNGVICRGTSTIFVALVDILEWMVIMTQQLTSRIFVGLKTMVVCAFSWLVSNALPTVNETAVLPAWKMLKALFIYLVCVICRGTSTIFVAVVDYSAWMVIMTLQLTSRIFVGFKKIVVCAFSWLVSNALPTLNGIFRVAKLKITAAVTQATVFLRAKVSTIVTVLCRRSADRGHSSSSDETAVLPDPPVSSSSRPMPYFQQYKESDSYGWHEGSDKGPSGNQKTGKNSTSADVSSQWSSIPFDEQYGSVQLISTSLEYKEMETNSPDQISAEETAVLPDPPVSGSSLLMSYCPQFEESDSYRWHEGSHKGTSGNQKAGRKATSTNVLSKWFSMPSDEQCRSDSLTSTSSEYQEMETLVEKTVKESVVIKCNKNVQNPSMWEKYRRYLILTINSTMPGLIVSDVQKGLGLPFSTSFVNRGNILEKRKKSDSFPCRF